MSTYQTPSLAVRLYDNPRYGARTGPRRLNHLVLNGTVLVNGCKVHIDLAQLEHIDQAVDPNAAHMSLVLTEMAAGLALSPQQEKDILVGQLKEVKPTCYVDGGLVVNLRTGQLKLFLSDEGELVFCEELQLERCSAPRDGKNSPNYLAANYDLELQVAAPDEAARAKATAMLNQMKQHGNPPSKTVVTADAVISILQSSAG